MNSQKGFIVPLLLVLIAIFLAGGGAYVYTQQKQANPPVTGNVALPQATSTAPTTNQTADWKMYTDSNNRFSVQYPTELTPNVEKVEKYMIDTVRFQQSPSSVAFQINIQKVTTRWPDLETLVNDQYLMSKGGDTPAPVFKVVSGGLKLQDVGLIVGSHLFVGQLNPSQFIVFSFKDESLVDQVLSSFKLPTNTKSVPVTLTTSDICSPVIEDASTLLFTDNNKKIWKIDYQNASFSEYSFSVGKVQGTEGLLKTTLQDWLKSLRHVGQSPAEICGAPGSVTITGTINASGVLVASSIKVTGQ